MDAKSGDSRTVLSSYTDESFLSEMEWLPGSTIAVLQVANRALQGAEHEGMYLFSSETGVLAPFAADRPTTSNYISVSPAAPYAVVLSIGGGKVSLTLIDGEGSSRNLSAPPVTDQVPDLYWSSDGNSLYCLTFDTSLKENVKERWHRINFDGSPPTAVAKPADAIKRKDLPTTPFNLSVEVEQVTKDKATRSIRALWAESPELEQPALIAANSTWGELSPKGDAVAYLAEGALFLRSLTEIDKSAYLKAKAAELKYAALIDAKMVATAAIMYATDNNDIVPTPAEFKDRLAAYVKDPSVFKDFVWTYPGGDLSKVKDASQVELGYIALPGGRAVTFLDGHSQWVPGK